MFGAFQIVHFFSIATILT